jgi:DNA polymerase I-like protein with 3'-5' exonuclease and polymerase domains
MVAEVDAMQLEFRVAAFLGQDEQALKDIADPDFDAHVFSASKIYAESYGELLMAYRRGESSAKMLRQQSKRHTFKPLYGGTKGTSGEERYYKAFAERYKGLAAVQENWLAEVMTTGRLELPWGMTFSWDTKVNRRGIAIDQRTYKPVGPQVYNYPVQNLATAEIVPIAITLLYQRCKEELQDVKFVNTIHDSVIALVPEDEISIRRYRKAAEWAFTEGVYDHLKEYYGIDFTVPLGMEMVIGKFWNEGTETKYDDVQERAA